MASKASLWSVKSHTVDCRLCESSFTLKSRSWRRSRPKSPAPAYRELSCGLLLLRSTYVKKSVTASYKKLVFYFILILFKWPITDAIPKFLTVVELGHCFCCRLKKTFRNDENMKPCLTVLYLQPRDGWVRYT